MDKARRKRERRRTVMAGYPKATVFATEAELDAYFAPERLTCLECGKTFRELGVHLLKIHSTTAEDYKSAHGIPWRRGLTGCDTKAMRRELGAKNMADGIFTPATPELSAKARATAKRKAPPVRRAMALARLAELNADKDGSDAALRRAAAERKAAGVPLNTGERHRWAKLTDEQVDEIRARLKAGAETQKQIAAAYGVGEDYVRQINTGKGRFRAPNT